ARPHSGLARPAGVHPLSHAGSARDVTEAQREPRRSRFGARPTTEIREERVAFAPSRNRRLSRSVHAPRVFAEIFSSHYARAFRRELAGWVLLSVPRLHFRPGGSCGNEQAGTREPHRAALQLR